MEPIQSGSLFEPVGIPALERPTADQSLLSADIRMLEERVRQRNLWSAKVVRELLQGAADAGLASNDVAKGREAFAKAQKIFDDDVQTKNRMFYLLGVFLGVGAVALIATAVVLARKVPLLSNLAPPEMIISISAFAGMGSVASVLTRLSSIDLKDELRRKMVTLSAGMRPILALLFASIVYVILKNDLVSISGFKPENGSKTALSWVAAFLCGFSERFAVDILHRLPFVESK